MNQIIWSCYGQTDNTETSHTCLPAQWQERWLAHLQQLPRTSPIQAGPQSDASVAGWKRLCGAPRTGYTDAVTHEEPWVDLAVAPVTTAGAVCMHWNKPDDDDD